MANTVKPIPEGYHSVTPYLIVHGASEALEFYKRAFGAKEVMRMDAPGGKIMHAEIKIGDSKIMLTDEIPDMECRGPKTIGGTAVMLYVMVPDVDAQAKQAVAAGAKVRRPVENQFYGDRMGTFEDPFGHIWHLATHVEDVPMDELKKRAAAAMTQR